MRTAARGKRIRPRPPGHRCPRWRVDKHQELACGPDAVAGRSCTSILVITGLDPVIHALFSDAGGGNAPHPNPLAVSGEREGPAEREGEGDASDASNPEDGEHVRVAPVSR